MVRYAGNLAALSAAFQLNLHLWWQIQSGNPFWIMPRLVSWLHDCVIILAIYLIAAAITGKIENKPGTPYFLAIPAALWLAAMSVLILYPRHVPDFLSFPVNIFSVDSGAAGEFFRQYVTYHDIAFVAAALAALAFMARSKLPEYSFRIKPFFKNAMKIVLLLFLVATLAAPSPNPIVFGAEDIIVSGIFYGGRVVAPLSRPAKPDAPGGGGAGSTAARAAASNNNAGEGNAAAAIPAAFSKEAFDSLADTVAKGPNKISNIIVIVMETVESDRFERELLNKPGTFTGSKRSEFRYFSNYYTPNLDSYTSLIAMLTSVAVPFQAYSDPGSFSGVQRAPNLVTALERAGMNCFYISTAENQPFIPVRNAWNKIFTRKTIRHDPGMAHIDSPPIESALEDRAALREIDIIMMKISRSFILHECVFGHTREWLDLTGKSQLEYYDLYMRELFGRLSANGLLEKTLVALVADHGSRGDASKLENYHVPLVLWGPGVRPGTDARFLSHLDFPGLLCEALCDKPWPAFAGPLLTVGHSGRWTYGEIRADKKYQFIDNYRGRVIGAEGGLDPLDLRRRFQGYIDRFSMAFSSHEEM